MKKIVGFYLLVAQRRFPHVVGGDPFFTDLLGITALPALHSTQCDGGPTKAGKIPRLDTSGKKPLPPLPEGMAKPRG